MSSIFGVCTILPTPKSTSGPGGRHNTPGESLPRFSLRFSETAFAQGWGLIASMAFPLSPAAAVSSRQMPERSGLPSAVRGAGAERFGLPSGRRGMPGALRSNHCAAAGDDAVNEARVARAAIAHAFAGLMFLILRRAAEF